jgi:predicted transglutaminase-like cysteine proteinase
MDVSDDSYYIQENNKNKGSRMGHTKKIFFKRQLDSNKNSWTEIKTNGLK